MTRSAGPMVGTSGQARSEHVATDVRELRSFDVLFHNNREPHAASPAMVGAGTVFSGSIIAALPMNAAPWRVEIEYPTGDTVIFDVTFGNRKTISTVLSLRFQPTGPVTRRKTS